MSAPLPSFFARLSIAFAAFFRALGDAQFAASVRDLGQGALPAAPATPALAEPAPQPVTTVPPKPEAKKDAKAEQKPEEKKGEASAEPRGAAKAAPSVPPAPPAASAHEGALNLLAIFQREGRLLDFCEEELAGFSDAAVGAAARLVHSGVRKAIKENLELSPVRAEAEGAQITIEAGFDPRAIRLTGNVVGNPPFKGALKHHGWKAGAVKLPEPPRGEAARLLAPAEVEL